MKKYKLKKEVKAVVIIALILISTTLYIKIYIDRIQAINDGKMTVQDQHEK